MNILNNDHDTKWLKSFNVYRNYILQKCFSKEHVSAIHDLASNHPDIIFCGSTSLVIAGAIQRKVHDIDVLIGDIPIDDIIDSGYDPSDSLESSNVFSVGDTIKVRCVKLSNGKIELDTFSVINQDIKWSYVDFFGHRIKVQNADDALAIKLQYVKSNPNIVSVLKHLRDLLESDVDKERIMEAIDIARKRIFTTFIS